MIRLNRTTEYGLIALRHMSKKRSQMPLGGTESLTSAREIADSYGLPFEITAKTLQRLKESGMIQSAHGSRGGYTLQRPLSEVSLVEFLTAMEGQPAVVACAGESGEASTDCEYGMRCEIKPFMDNLNSRLLIFLRDIRLAELAEGSAAQLIQLSTFEKESDL